MAAGSGNDFILKVGDGATSEAFTQVASMTDTNFAIDGQTVDITTKDSSGAQTLLSAGGRISMTVGASGIYTDAATFETVRGYAFARTLNNYELVLSSGDKISGAFQVTNLGMTGTVDGTETFTLSLASSGTLTFTAA